MWQFSAVHGAGEKEAKECYFKSTKKMEDMNMSDQLSYKSQPATWYTVAENIGKQA